MSHERRLVEIEGEQPGHNDFSRVVVVARGDAANWIPTLIRCQHVDNLELPLRILLDDCAGQNGRKTTRRFRFQLRVVSSKQSTLAEQQGMRQARPRADIMRADRFGLRVNVKYEPQLRDDDE